MAARTRCYAMHILDSRHCRRERARYKQRKPLIVAYRSIETTATGQKAKPKEHMSICSYEHSKSQNFPYGYYYRNHRYRTVKQITRNVTCRGEAAENNVKAAEEHA
jgi:hypothetical protein